MRIRSDRPVYISVSQYMDELQAGTMLVADVVEKACTLGADGVELRREPWPAYQRELVATRQLVESLKLGVTFATHNLLFSPDEDAHRLLLHDVDTAAALGAPLLRIFPGHTPPDEDTAGWAGAMEAVERAAAHGIAIALENYVGTPGGTLAEVAHILDRIQSPALKTNIDIGNYVVRGQDVVEAIRAVGHRAVYAHLKDRPADPAGSHAYLGGGTMSLRPILAELDGLPQEMIYCFEFPGGGDPDGHIKKSLAYLGLSKCGRSGQMSNQILITTAKFHGYDEYARSFLQARGFELIEHQLHREMDGATLLRMVPPAAGLIAGPERVSDEVMAAAPRLRVVNAPGVGYDHIDVDAATRRGIVVCTNPGCNHHAVAEMTLGMMLCLARKICPTDRRVRQGEWPTVRGIELRGKTLGIVGLGRIGKSLAASARGMGMRVLASDTVQDLAFAEQRGVRYVSLQELIPASDFLSLHCPLAPETRRLIDARALAQMKPTAYLINTARGALVDQAALVAALREGRIAGAGIDVYDTEPLLENPYAGLDNVVQTPHCAGHSLEAIQSSLEMALENITRVLQGQEPLHRIN